MIFSLAGQMERIFCSKYVLFEFLFFYCFFVCIYSSISIFLVSFSFLSLYSSYKFDPNFWYTFEIRVTHNFAIHIRCGLPNDVILRWVICNLCYIGLLCIFVCLLCIIFIVDQFVFVERHIFFNLVVINYVNENVLQKIV